VRFVVEDAIADAGTRIVDITREHVVLRRALQGMKMAIRLPLSGYLGVTLRIEPPSIRNGAIEIALEHRDPALSVPLYRGGDGWDVIADWRSWGGVLGRPLLLAEADGRLREAVARIGALRVGRPAWRRRRRGAISRRRPAILLRRRPGRRGPAAMRESEPEVIATR
jgi:hypothetical protein